MEKFTKIGTPISIKEVEEVAEFIFNKAKESIRFTLRMAEMFSVSGLPESFNNTLSDACLDGDYRKECLDSETFRAIIINYICSMKLRETTEVTYETVVSDSIILSKAAGVDMSKSSTLCPEIRIAEYFNINVDAFHPSHQMDILNKNTTLEANKAAEEYFDIKDNRVDPLDHDTFDEFMTACESIAGNLAMELLTVGYVANSHKYLVAVVASRSVSTGPAYEVEPSGGTEMTDGIASVFMESIKFNYMSDRNEKVDPKDVIASLIKTSMVKRGIVSSVESDDIGEIIEIDLNAIGDEIDDEGEE